MHQVMDKFGATEFPTMQVGITDILRPEPLFLEQVGRRLAEQCLDHLIDSVIPIVWFVWFQCFARNHH